MSKIFGNNGATFSDCGKYRYRLWRVWDESLPLVMCIGLNPSKATTDRNDATISLLTRVLLKLGYGGFYMMNLFAYISSKPKDLLTCSDPLGDNDRHLSDVSMFCHDVIVCWGAFKQASERIKVVTPWFPQAKCFGKNKDGTPQHPLALMYNGTQGNPQLHNFTQYKTVNNE